MFYCTILYIPNISVVPVVPWKQYSIAYCKRKANMNMRLKSKQSDYVNAQD